MATIFNLFLDQGTTFKANVTIKDNTGIVRNISGHTARSQFRRSIKSSNSHSFTATIPVGTDGNVFLSMNSNTTTNVTAARYLYDIEIVNDSNDEIERVAEGIVIVSPEITR
tara:strand:- start:629 stop:964 length:336 start_codon:yes stop_codon:yes gene_type:complete